MLLFKACSKCNGDIIIEEDKNYRYFTGLKGKSYDISCLMCGATKSVIIESKEEKVAS